MASKPITSDRALARALGVTHTTIAGWRSRFPEEVPSDYNLEAWQALVAKHDLGESGPKATNADLKAEKLKHEVEILRIKIEKEKGRLIETGKVDELLHHIAARQRILLTQLFEVELPPRVEGLPAAQVRPILRAAADQICDEMGPIVERWKAA